MKKVYLQMGMTALVTPGVLDLEADRAFRFGHCHSLAVALHEVTGWPFILLWSHEDEWGVEYADENDWHICHVAVAPYSDQWIVDVEGLHSLDAEAETYETDLIFTVDNLVQTLDAEDNDWKPLDLDLARPFVIPVLESTGLQHTLSRVKENA